MVWFIPAIIAALQQFQQQRQKNIKSGSAGGLGDIMQLGAKAYSAYSQFASDQNGVNVPSVATKKGLDSMHDLPSSNTQFGTIGSDYNPYV